MKRIGMFAAAIALSLSLAGPVGAAGFPDAGKPHSCDAVQSIPKDLIGHLFTVAPATAARLLALLTEVCG